MSKIFKKSSNLNASFEVNFAQASVLFNMQGHKSNLCDFIQIG